MSLWMVIVLLALLKLPIAALMLWIPFRNDQAMHMAAPVDADVGRIRRRTAAARRCPPARWIPTRARPDRAPSPGTSRSDPVCPSPPRVRTPRRRHRQRRRDAGADRRLTPARL